MVREMIREFAIGMLERAADALRSPAERSLRAAVRQRDESDDDIPLVRVGGNPVVSEEARSMAAPRTQRVAPPPAKPLEGSLEARFGARRL